MSGFQCIEERDGVRCTGKPWRGQERCEPCREKREAILNRRIVVPVPKRAEEQVLPSRDEMVALAAGSAEVAPVRPKYIGLMSEAAALTLKNLEEKREEQRMAKQQAAAVKVTPPEAPEVKVELKQAPEAEPKAEAEAGKPPLRSKQERFDFLATLGSEFTPADVGDRFGCGSNGTLHWLLDHTVRTRPGFYRLPKPGEKVSNAPRKKGPRSALKRLQEASKPKSVFKPKKASKPAPAPAPTAPKTKAPYAQVCDLLEQLTPIELRGVRRLAKDRIAKRAAILKAELGELEAELGGQDASLTHGSVAALPRESVLPVERTPMDNENQ
jgi:hypothetical protein